MIRPPTMANTPSGLSAASLRRAADIQDKIEALQRELASLLGGQPAAPAAAAPAPAAAKTAAAGNGRRRRRNMSPEARARIGAAARARWARYRAQKDKAAK